MQKFRPFGRKKKNRPKFDIEWLCSKVFNYKVGEIVALFSYMTTLQRIQIATCYNALALKFDPTIKNGSYYSSLVGWQSKR